MDEEKDYRYYLNYINNNSDRPEALLYGCIFIAFLFVPLNKILADPFILSIIILVALVSYIIGWIYLRVNIPKNKKRLGILISIQATDQKLTSKIRKDFVQEIDKCVSKNSIADSIDIYFLSGVKAEKYNTFFTSTKRGFEELQYKGLHEGNKKSYIKKSKKWMNFLKKTDRTFCIWGDSYEENSEVYLRLNGLVYHGLVDNITRQIIRTELNIIFPQEVKIKGREGFTISARHFSIVIKYICSFAALGSKKYELALDLQRELLKELENSQPLPQSFTHLKSFLKELLALTLAALCVKEFEKGNVQRAIDCLLESLKYDETNYKVLNLRTYLEFSINKNIDLAIEYADKSSHYSEKDYVWAYNKAFLLMYKEEFKSALKLYKKIFSHSFTNEVQTVSEVIDFNKKILQENPEKIQCLFIIGHVLSKKSKDLIHAYTYFSDFVKKAGKKQKYQEMVYISNAQLKKADKLIKTK